MDIRSWIEILKNGKVLSERDVKNLCIKVIEIFSEVLYIKIYDNFLILRNQMYNQSLRL